MAVPPLSSSQRLVIPRSETHNQRHFTLYTFAIFTVYIGLNVFVSIFLSLRDRPMPSPSGLRTDEWPGFSVHSPPLLLLLDFVSSRLNIPVAEWLSRPCHPLTVPSRSEAHRQRPACRSLALLTHHLLFLSFTINIRAPSLGQCHRCVCSFCVSKAPLLTFFAPAT